MLLLLQAAYGKIKDSMSIFQDAYTAQLAVGEKTQVKQPEAMGYTGGKRRIPALGASVHKLLSQYRLKK